MTTDSSRTGLSAHRERYVAVVSPDDIDGLIRDLDDVGIAGNAIDVFDDVLDESVELAPETEHDKSAKNSVENSVENSVKNIVRRIFGFDQVEVERIYVEALEAGQAVVRVHVPEDDDETRAQVEEALLDHGGRFIHYFGKWSYVEVAEDADRADDRTT